MRLPIPLPIMASFLLIALPAQAAENQKPIVRCLLLSAVLGKSPDVKAQEAGRLSGIYWLGRLDPALDEAAVTKMVIAEAAQTKVADLQADIPRCQGELATRGAMIGRVGKAMQDAGKVPAK